MSLQNIAAVSAFAITLLSGCVTTVPGASQPPSGMWQGNIKQHGPGNSRLEYPVAMTLNGISGGVVEYPTLGCRGRLEFSGMQGQSGVYREHFPSGTTGCINNVIVTLKPSGDDLQYSVARSNLVATGIIRPSRK